MTAFFFSWQKHARKQFSANCKAESQFLGRVAVHVSVPLRSVCPSVPSGVHLWTAAFLWLQVGIIVVKFTCLIMVTDFSESSVSRERGQEEEPPYTMSITYLTLHHHHLVMYAVQSLLENYQFTFSIYYWDKNYHTEYFVEHRGIFSFVRLPIQAMTCPEKWFRQTVSYSSSMSSFG
jgi:hypothetical protein